MHGIYMYWIFVGIINLGRGGNSVVKYTKINLP